MNYFALCGRITKDIEVSYTGNNTAVCKPTLAVDRKDGADFIRFTAFGQMAENLAKYKHKGDQIIVEGRIQTGSYEGKNGKVFTIDFIATKIEYLGRSESNDAPPKEPEQETFENFAMDSSEIPF